MDSVNLEKIMDVVMYEYTSYVIKCMAVTLQHFGFVYHYCLLILLCINTLYS
jgi:hypothetical protein